MNTEQLENLKTIFSAHHETMMKLLKHQNSSLGGEVCDYLLTIRKMRPNDETLKFIDDLFQLR